MTSRCWRRLLRPAVVALAAAAPALLLFGCGAEDDGAGGSAGGFLGDARLAMKESSSRRLQTLLQRPSLAPSPARRLDMAYVMPHENEASFLVSSEDPTMLCVDIVYAYAVESNSWMCGPEPRDPSQDYPPDYTGLPALVTAYQADKATWDGCETWGPKNGNGAAAKGDCINGNDKCQNAIIYENPGCCTGGGVPGVEADMDKCTWNARDKDGCQSSCDVHHTSAVQGCAAWPGGKPIAGHANCVDLARGSAAVNGKLGAAKVPILGRQNGGQEWLDKGGKFRGVRVDFGGKDLPQEQDERGNTVIKHPVPSGAENVEVKCPGISETKLWYAHMGQQAEYYFKSEQEYLELAPGDSLEFSLSYTHKGLCKVYKSWEVVGRDCLECAKPANATAGTPAEVLDCNQGDGSDCAAACGSKPWTFRVKDTVMCKRRTIGCFEGDVSPHVYGQTGHVVCLKLHDLNLVPSVTKVDGEPEAAAAGGNGTAGGGSA